MSNHLTDVVRKIDWKLFDKQIAWLSMRTRPLFCCDADELGEGLLNLLGEIEHAAQQDGLKKCLGGRAVNRGQRPT